MQNRSAGEGLASPALFGVWWVEGLEVVAEAELHAAPGGEQAGGDADVAAG
jgi:hypothetical protein